MTTFSREATSDIHATLRQLLADVFALYMKTKKFHWHMTGRHFRDYHLLLDEQAEQIFAMSDGIAERARKKGGTTIRSIGDISRNQRLQDSDGEGPEPAEMMAEVRDDNARLIGFLREAHEICGRHDDVGTTSIPDVWIDQTERRIWFLTAIAPER